MIRGLKALIALGAVAGLGFGLRWVTSGATAQASVEDLTSMAFLAVGAVAWVAYAWLLVAVLATVLEQAPGVLGRGGSVVAGAITSQNSRALLRSALGVAAVTPLTIGVAHAVPGDGPQEHSWTATEPASTVSLTPGTTDWRATEKPSSLRLTDEAARPPGGRASAGRSAADHADAGRTAGARRSDVPAKPVQQPRRSQASTDTRPEVSPNEWRATEKPSSLRLTEPAASSHKLPRRLEPPNADQRADHPQQPPRDQPVHPQTDQPGRPQTDQPGRPQADQPGRPQADERAEARTQGRTGEPGRPSVRVPDRPTDGAPTRYTDLSSGQLLRNGSHVVVRGDSLWSIAAAELGANADDTAIAGRWPQWYAANRAVIGPDPDLLLPGQVLHAPASLDRPVPPTHQEK